MLMHGGRPCVAPPEARCARRCKRGDGGVEAWKRRCQPRHALLTSWDCGAMLMRGGRPCVAPPEARCARRCKRALEGANQGLLCPRWTSDRLCGFGTCRPIGTCLACLTNSVLYVSVCAVARHVMSRCCVNGACPIPRGSDTDCQDRAVVPSARHRTPHIHWLA